MQSFKIRNILPSDNPKLSFVIKSVLTELGCNLKGTAYYDKETDAMYNAYQKEKTVYFVAELNNEIVGGCGIGILENNTCELQKMYILPKARGYKIGYQLLQKCIDFAIKNDYDNIYLETFPQMKSAISLYQKNGFFRIDKSLGNTCHYSCNVWMLKPLKRNVLTLKTEFISALSEIYTTEESNHFFTLLAKEYLNLSRVEIALQPDLMINEKKLHLFYNGLEKLKNQEPIQYIIGKTEFYNNLFFVNKSVLIPRPETEELVDWIVKENKNTKKTLNILDIGTGSGCIAISLAKNLPSAVTAIDVLVKALETAEKNAQLNNVKITLLNKNILENKDLKLSEKQDIIVSNPPYVREQEKEQMQKNVLNYEPHLALFVNNDNPLLFYNAIADFALKNLKPNGKLYFEINEFLGNKTVALLQEKGFKNVVLKKDIFGKDRMVRGYLV